MLGCLPFGPQSSWHPWHPMGWFSFEGARMLGGLPFSPQSSWHPWHPMGWFSLGGARMLGCLPFEPQSSWHPRDSGVRLATPKITRAHSTR